MEFPLADMSYQKLAAAFIIERPSQRFTSGPLTENTFYHPSLYRPIIPPDTDNGLFVFAGVTYPYNYDERLLLHVEPQFVCISSNPALVETYMFSVRKYECYHTIESKDYGGEYYKPVGITRAAGEIRYAFFPDRVAYKDFLQKHTTLKSLHLSHCKFKIDKQFINFLPGHDKIRIPKIIEEIIDDERESFGHRFPDILHTLKYLLLISNLDNERFRDTTLSHVKTLQETIQIIEDFQKYFELHGQSLSGYDGTTDIRILEAMWKNIERRAPILFSNEAEYQMAVRSKIEANQMELSYQRTVNEDFPLWDRVNEMAAHGDSRMNKFITGDQIRRR